MSDTRDDDGAARAPLGLPAWPVPAVDGRRRGRGQDPRPVRAGDVAAQLRALLPHQEPAPLGEGDEAARPPELVRGAAAGRQRHPAHGPALHRDPHRGPGQPGPLRQVRRGLPQEGRRRRPLHREAHAAVHAGGGSHPAAGGAGGPARRPHGPDAPLADPLRHLHRGGEDALPRDPAQPPPGHAHRQEVQAHPRPDQSPAMAATIRGDRGADRAQAGGASVFLELFRLLHYLEYADPAHGRTRTSSRTRS